MIKFLAITDIHYCNKDKTFDRRHRLSAEKLKKIINEHSKGCNFIVNLGDTADRMEGYGNQEILMEEIAKILKNSGLPFYCAIGNHDTALSKHKIERILSMPNRYYSFDTEDYTCLVLDANMNDPLKPYPNKEILWEKTYLDSEQLQWMNQTITETSKPVLIFCHELFMLENFENRNDHIIMNRDDAIEIFEKSRKVKAVFCGHYHFGDYVKHKDIHYIVFHSLCRHEDLTCAVVTIDDGKVEIEGFGLQSSMKFEL